jgi:hypothetical protein
LNKTPVSRLFGLFQESYKLKYLGLSLLLILLLILDMFLLRKSIILLEGDGQLELFSLLKHSPLRLFGLAWFSSAILLSGSPIAALIVGLADAGKISSLDAVFGIMGTRLGAVSLVFFIGAILLLRGKKLKLSMGIGLVSFVVSAVMALLVIALASIFWPFFNVPVEIVPAAGSLNSPSLPLLISEWIISHTGPFPGFLLSIAFLILLMDLLEKSFRLRDIKEKDHKVIRPLFENPITSFLLGFILTGLFFSVSVTIALLVPLYDVGRVRRAWAVPYIIAANISTFIDTYLLALSGGNEQTISLVTFCILASLLVGMVLMVRIDAFSKKVVDVSDSLLKNNWIFALVVVLMLALPLILSSF